MHALPLLILLLSTLPLYGHSGAVAVAVPIAGITLDGDLSDWPEGMRSYDIANQVNGFYYRVSGAADFQANFRVGYDASEDSTSAGW